MPDALKIFLLLTASFGVTGFIFYELGALCAEIGISPWLGVAAYIGMFFAWFRRECGRAA